MEPLNIYNVTQTQLLPLFCTVEMRGWRHYSAISVIEDTHFRSSVKLGVTITSNSDTKGKKTVQPPLPVIAISLFQPVVSTLFWNFFWIEMAQNYFFKKDS